MFTDRLSHRVVRSSHATNAAVEKSLNRLKHKNQDTPNGGQTDDNGNTNWVFNETSHPFSQAGMGEFNKPGNVLMTLWDPTGNTDTIDARYMATRVLIDLRPGEFSAIGTQDGVTGVIDTKKLNVGIAFGAVIENAVGGEGDDFIVGNSVSNKLEGNAGKDTLDGGVAADAGTGNVAIGRGDGAVDRLEGGIGFDKYVLRQNGGQDEIKDADGGRFLQYGESNSILKTIEQVFFRSSPSSDSGESVSGKESISISSGTLTLADADTNISLVIADYTASNFGIRLLDLPTSPATTRTILGDFTPQDSDPNTSGIQITADDLGNDVLSDNYEPGREDIVSDSAGADFINTGGGNDEILATRGGSDWILAGTGRDIVSDTGGDNYIEAGVNGSNGGDSVFSGAGNDTIFAGNAPADFIVGLRAIRDAITASGLQGDLISSGGGDDIVIGSEDEELVFGGTGKDLILGGAGDDTIYADDSATGGINWILARDVDASGSAPQFYVTIDNVTPTVGGTAGGADTVFGGWGKDWIFAGAADDYVDAGVGDDVVFGETGNDVIIGGDGDDVLSGDSGSVTDVGLGADDYVDGGDGLDTIYGGVGDDYLIGGAGIDYINGGEGNDVIYGGAGNDTLIGGTGKDTYLHFLGDGVDIVNDVPNAANPSDASFVTLGAGISRNQIKFRLGSLMIDMGGGDAIHLVGFDPDDPYSSNILDSIQFADGSLMSYQDVLDQGFDLDGTEGDDYIDGTVVTDRIDGKGGHDTIVAKAGNDAILGGSGDDEIAAGAGNDTIDGGEGDDIINAGEGDDTIITGEGIDLVFGGAGTDAFVAGDGDVILDSEGTNTLDVTAFGALTTANLEITQYEAEGGDLYLNLHVRDPQNIGWTPETGGVSIQGTHLDAFGGITLNDGSGGTVTLTGAEALAQFAAQGLIQRGDTSADTLIGTDFNDALFSGDGADVIQAKDGDDYLDGGKGDDVLDGGAGNDTYRLAFNGGRDTVLEDGAAEPNATHTIELGEGISHGMVNAYRLGDDLQVRLGATADALVIEDYYTQPQSWQDGWSVRDSQGQSVSIAELAQVEQPEPQDWLASQKIAYRAQREQVFGANRIGEQFGALGANAYRTVQYGFSYTGQTTTTNTLINRLEASTPPAANGSVTLVGITSDSASISALGSYVPGVTVQASVTIVAKPTVRGTGLHRAPVTVNTAGNVPEGTFIPLLSSGLPGFSGAGFAAPAGAVLVPVYTARVGIPPKTGINNSGSNPSQFDDASVWQLSGYRVHYPGQTAPPGETYPVQVVDPGETVNTVTTTDGKVTMPDVFAGESDNAISAQVAVVEAGAGNDTITLGAINPGGTVRADEFFTLANWRASFNMDAYVQFLSPSDSQRAYQVAKKSVLARTSGDHDFIDREDALGGFVDAGSGDDTVNGSAGQDVIAGGDGADYLDGAGGSDVYLYSADETGVDILSDYGSSTYSYLEWYYWNQGILNWDERMRHGGEYRIEVGDFDVATYDNVEYTDNPDPEDETTYIEFLPAAPRLTRNDTAEINELMAKGVLARDVVRFGPGLSIEDLVITVDVDPVVALQHPEQPWYEGGTLSVRWGDAGFDVVIPDVQLGYAGDDLPIDAIPDQEAYRLGEGIEAFEFTDGTSYSLEEFLQFRLSPDEILGTEDDDYLEGGETSDVIRGFDGQDSLVGLEGDDVLDGGAGNDYLSGGDGDDIYLLSPNQGQDFLFDDSGNDTIVVAAGVSPDALLVTTDPYGDLILDFQNQNGYVVIEGWFLDDNQKIENLIFADGTAWDIGEIEARVATLGATAFDDWINSASGDDVVNALGGDDYVLGNEGNDILAGGEGNDFIEGNAGNNLLLGGAGNDVLDAGIFGERMLSIGAAGYDESYGSDSPHIVLFNAGDGEDFIYTSAEGAFVLSLGGGIDTSDIAISHDDSGAIRMHLGASDSVLLGAYQGDEEFWPAGTLQIVAGDVRLYDLNEVMQAFHDAWSLDPELGEWSQRAH